MIEVLIARAAAEHCAVKAVLFHGAFQLKRCFLRRGCGKRCESLKAIGMFCNRRSE